MTYNELISVLTNNDYMIVFHFNNEIDEVASSRTTFPGCPGGRVMSVYIGVDGKLHIIVDGERK